MTDHERPPGASDELVEAVGKASEALEYVERVRGLLYSAHQLMGRADLVFEEAAEQLAAAGEAQAGGRLMTEIVGRNVLDGRWTFQIVEEFDDVYYEAARDEVRALEERFMGGRRHVFEAELKARRRSCGAPGHEDRPPAAYSALVETTRSNGERV